MLAKFFSKCPSSDSSYKQIYCFNYQGLLSYIFPKPNTIVSTICSIQFMSGLPPGRFVSEACLEKFLKLSGLIDIEMRVCPQASRIFYLTFLMKLFAAIIFWLIKHDIFQHAVWYAVFLEEEKWTLTNFVWLPQLYDILLSLIHLLRVRSTIVIKNKTKQNKGGLI